MGSWWWRRWRRWWWGRLRFLEDRFCGFYREWWTNGMVPPPFSVVVRSDGIVLRRVFPLSVVDSLDFKTTSFPSFFLI